MDEPIILAVDDEPGVLRAIARDLRQKFGAEYRVLRADSGQAALESLRELRLKSEPVALLVVDQRMPGMTGVELLSQAIDIYPDVKRVLLTGYADTEAAIRAINEIRLDHYLTKPWHPPEEQLYPVLEGLLEDWQATFRPDFDGIRLVGHRWSAQTHQLKDFLARNRLPYEWVDVEADARASEILAAAGADERSLPVVALPEGAALIQPTESALAERLGLRTRAESPFYDLVIVGGGPAGLAAAVYGASEGLRTLLVESQAPGGQAGTSSRIENYLGFPNGLSGTQLARSAVAQSARFGAELLTPVRVCEVQVQGASRTVVLADGNRVDCHALLIATGVAYRTLDAPGIERLTGAGVYYGAALTEARACQELDVVVVGGGNSAGQGALHLASFARHVTILVRGDSLASSMSRYLIDRIETNPKITLRTHAAIAEAHGERSLERLTLSSSKTGVLEELPAQAAFIFIGAQPHTEWVAGVVERDAQGFIYSGPDTFRDGRPPRTWTLDRQPYWLETSLPGIFVAGDVRHRSVKRVASAVGEGSMAVQFIHQYLGSL